MKKTNQLMGILQIKYLEILNKIADEKGDPDGGGLSWIAKTGIAFSVLAAVGLLLNAAFPGIINTIFTKVASFFS